ncbi:Avr1b-1 avirulence-like protein [Phytophthora cinnamomi]|uniref:Avr1b-1 avirulence-like protein n=1 Tax=Phytophthora cinnamomi TaxID=4785 RepID=UPI002A2ED0BD|nr:Avr1b-1 avirulence-like protein [Phytophthora cinnamomi]KAJ8535016.1 hypothetical protein ON010_g13722 [Phytophthora cinnamomi]
MRTLRLLVLLVLLLLATCHAITTNKQTTETDRDGIDLTSGESEERGLTPEFVSEVGVAFGKNSAITQKIESIRNNPEIAAGVEKSPVLKKLETAAVNDPNFVNTLKKNPEVVKQLHKDPEVAKISVSLEKKNTHFHKEDFKQLRAALAKDSSKDGKLAKILDVLEKAMTLVAKASFTVLVFLLVIAAVAYVTHAT